MGRLRALHPGWDIWIVSLYPKGTAWCARPKGAPVATHRALDPDELRDDLAEAERVREKSE